MQILVFSLKSCLNLNEGKKMVNISSSYSSNWWKCWFQRSNRSGSKVKKKKRISLLIPHFYWASTDSDAAVAGRSEITERAGAAAVPTGTAVAGSTGRDVVVSLSEERWNGPAQIAAQRRGRKNPLHSMSFPANHRASLSLSLSLKELFSKESQTLLPPVDISFPLLHY